MASPQIVKEWLKKADEDFNFASSIIDDTAFYAQLCFHFHQASEKYFKAFIVAHDLEFKKIHDLIALHKICVKKEPSIKPLLNDCNILNRYYIDTRYPAHWQSEYDKNEALMAQKAAKNIALIIKGTLRDTISF
ncbi:MAG: HEPN domain-containing protein [Desulfobacterales bacterium]|jgi:HEPN domain-containing protein|nr:HEPN domain-containing protein [Desulfobacterales bacterium]